MDKTGRTIGKRMETGREIGKQEGPIFGDYWEVGGGTHKLVSELCGGAYNGLIVVEKVVMEL